jgi:hypothetical protein
MHPFISPAHSVGPKESVESGSTINYDECVPSPTAMIFLRGGISFHVMTATWKQVSVTDPGVVQLSMHVTAIMLHTQLLDIKALVLIMVALCV